MAIRYCDQFCILVLADGLGSGVKANILSTLTSTIICEMMAEGATLQEAVDTITATLPQCQERGIAYSTFTIVQIYYDGTAHLIEFDNPAAVIMRRGNCIELQRTTRVIGQRRIRESSLQVEPNDFIHVAEEQLQRAGEITTDLGETLSWPYLCWVREHPLHWHGRTQVLYRSEEHTSELQSR